MDLADPRARDCFFNEALDGAAKALVLTEGLLMYLEESDVRALSGALQRPEVSWWMLDFAGPGLKRMMNHKMAGLLQNAPFKFAAGEWSGVLRKSWLARRGVRIIVHRSRPF